MTWFVNLHSLFSELRQLDFPQHSELLKEGYNHCVHIHLFQHPFIHPLYAHLLLLLIHEAIRGLLSYASLSMHPFSWGIVAISQWHYGSKVGHIASFSGIGAGGRRINLINFIAMKMLKGKYSAGRQSTSLSHTALPEPLHLSCNICIIQSPTQLWQWTSLLTWHPNSVSILAFPAQFCKFISSWSANTPAISVLGPSKFCQYILVLPYSTLLFQSCIYSEQRHAQ